MEPVRLYVPAEGWVRSEAMGGRRHHALNYGKVLAVWSYYDKILHKRKFCYLGSGGVMLSMQQSTLINHIEYKLDKLSVSRQMCE